MTKPSKSVAKPLVYGAESRAAICEAVANGIGLKTFLRETEGMPTWSTVYGWIKNEPEFAKAMEEARAIGADSIAEDVLEIVDDGRNDWMASNDKNNPGYIVNGEAVQRSKMRAEYRLKLLAKWHPKKYGDKVQQEITNPDGSLSGLTDEQLDAKIKALTNGKA